MKKEQLLYCAEVAYRRFNIVVSSLKKKGSNILQKREKFEKKLSELNNMKMIEVCIFLLSIIRFVEGVEKFKQDIYKANNLL